MSCYEYDPCCSNLLHLLLHVQRILVFSTVCPAGFLMLTMFDGIIRLKPDSNVLTQDTV